MKMDLVKATTVVCLLVGIFFQTTFNNGIEFIFYGYALLMNLLNLNNATLVPKDDVKEKEKAE